MVDVNCPWTPEEARIMALKMKQFDIHWLEEPINPPEDFDSLAKLASDTGVPIAAGENACTAFEFKKMMSGAVSFAQPSVAKVRDYEFRKIAALAEVLGPSLCLTRHILVLHF